MQLEMRNDFKGSDALVLLGDRGDFIALAEGWSDWAKQERVCNFSDLLTGRSIGGSISVGIQPTAAGGLSGIRWSSEEGGRLLWMLTPEVATQFAGLIEGLVERQVGHTYLESPDDELLVVCSLGES